MGLSLGNNSRGWRYELGRLPVLTDTEVNNLTNKAEVLNTPLQWNYPQQPGLRVFVQTDEYFLQSVLSEDVTEDWPVNPFFDASQNPGQNYNCYTGRGVYMDVDSGYQRIPWKAEDKSWAAARGRGPDWAVNVIWCWTLV